MKVSDPSNSRSRVLIAVPSKCRYDRILNHTGSWLLKPHGVDFRVFVEPSEVVLYSKVIPKQNLVNIGQNDQGFYFVLNCIGQYAKAKGYEYVWKIDDDCNGFSLWPEKDPVESMLSVLDDIIPDMDADPSVGAVRFIHKRIWLFDKRNVEKKYSHRNQPIWSSAIYRTACYPVLPAEVRELTDTIHSLILWKNGFDTLTYRKCGMTIQQKTGKGGFQCFDRADNISRTLAYLKEAFPLVKQKANSNERLAFDADISAYEKRVCL